MNALRIIEETLEKELTDREKALVFMAYAIGRAEEKEE